MEGACVTGRDWSPPSSACSLLVAACTFYLIARLEAFTENSWVGRAAHRMDGTDIFQRWVQGAFFRGAMESRPAQGDRSGTSGMQFCVCRAVANQLRGSCVHVHTTCLPSRAAAVAIHPQVHLRAVRHGVGVCGLHWRQRLLRGGCVRGMSSKRYE